ncbi:hypothetical protein [Pseudoclavibacter sp. AY1F1]|uniref:hypothetical protein n=1 Tax=Pseudoclavibacter sp. AY1F1 TaxID=2080583 RepID=UPI0011B0DCD5|nr:hypothetical protein [Pseudoclavibacter sp. AY1F1]
MQNSFASRHRALEKPTDRRSLIRNTAWAVPAIATAIAAPLASASTSADIDVGAYVNRGSCGVLGVIGPGFTLSASSTVPLPVNTTITIIGSGIANIGTFSASGGTASITTLSGTARQAVLTSPLPAGATLALRTTLSISVAFAMNAVVSLPSGYIGTGAKSAASVSSTLILCSGT